MNHLKQTQNIQGGAQFFLACGDVICALGAFQLTGMMSGLFQVYHSEIGNDLGGLSATSMAGAVLLFALMVQLGVYPNSLVLRWRESIRRVFQAVCLWAIFLFIFIVWDSKALASGGGVIFVSFVMFAFLVLWRFLAQKVFLSRFDGLRLRVLLVGDSCDADELISVLSGNARLPYSVCGLVRANAEKVVSPESGCPVYSSIERLGLAVNETRAQSVLVMDPDLSRAEIFQISEFCIRANLDFKLRTTAFEMLSTLLTAEMVGGTPVLGRREVRASLIFCRVIKRGMDLFIAIPAFVFTAPLVFLCGFLLKREDSGPALFRQTRVGVYGQEFTMLKLRSMKMGSEEDDRQHRSTLGDDARLLKIGKTLRRSNIDELPQLWSVIRGDMSLVGPRPERPYHVENLSREITHYGFRHLVKPGITGWAQVNGLKGGCDFSERARFDLFYIENWSPLLDLQILFLTLFHLKDDEFCTGS